MTEYKTNYTLSEQPTEEQNNCDHHRVYSDFSLATLPPTHFWICSKCLIKGESQTSEVPGTSYDDLCKLKKERQAKND